MGSFLAESASVSGVYGPRLGSGQAPLRSRRVWARIGRKGSDLILWLPSAASALRVWPEEGDRRLRA